MPPVLGWAAMTGAVPAQALLLFLIIFAWTPPHFWSLALFRGEDYRRAGLPMLPVTHGEDYTRLHVFFYTLLLSAVTGLPVLVGLCGWIYALSAFGLNAIYIAKAFLLWRRPSVEGARSAFAWSILYLTLLFASMLLDHGLPIPF